LFCKIKVKSAGIVMTTSPLNKVQVRVGKEFGFNINGKPKGISKDLLKWAELIIIAADNVPKSIFKYQGKYLQKIINWKIKDITINNEVQNKDRVKKIMKKVDILNIKLNNHQL